MKYVIVGNGAAGTTAAAELRKMDQNGDIEIISEENIPGYNRPMLTKGILAKISNPNFNIKPHAWYEENNIKLTLDSRAENIDIDKNELSLANGEIRSYDKLILALGAVSAVPRIPGADLSGVFSVRTKKDIDGIAAYLENAEKVVVIGGGLLGLEAAWEIKKAGKQVTVVHDSPFLMNRQLDRKGSSIIREITEKAGIEVNAGSGCEHLVGIDGSISGVQLGDGSMLAADMVIFSAGIKPNVDLAARAGIKTGRFIEVNEKMETSIENIYACGDCAAFESISYGLWGQAVEMGKVAGINAAGGDMKYETIIPSTFFNGMGTMLFSVGDPGANPDKNYDSTENYDPEKQIYEKFYYVDGKLAGGILIGDIKKSNGLLKAFKDKEDFR